MEETGAIQHSAESGTGEIRNSRDPIFLEQFVGEEATSLMGILRSYVVQYRLADKNEEVQDAALGLLHEVYIRAAKSFASFDRSRPIRAWLLGIARKLALDKQAALGRRRQHETLMCDLYQQTQDRQREEDPLERLLIVSQTGPDQQTETRDQITYLLSQLSEEYRRVILLWAVEELDGTELAEKLGCSYKSAIVRLHRARKQLRTIMESEEGARNG